jgi:multicomponent Na+:H+ antiporter subunit A
MLTTAGAATMLIGAYLSITQTDIKAILAYTTINALGTLVLLAGIDTKLSLKAAMIFLFVHAMYKATLFMIAGQLEKKTGTRDLHAFGGLRKYMPITFWISILAAFSMAGLPPMLGFLGKELIYEAKVQLAAVGAPVLVMGILSNILMVTVSLSFLYKIFLGKVAHYAQPPFERNACCCWVRPSLFW